MRDPRASTRQIEADQVRPAAPRCASATGRRGERRAWPTCAARRGAPTTCCRRCARRCAPAPRWARCCGVLREEFGEYDRVRAARPGDRAPTEKRERLRSAARGGRPRAAPRRPSSASTRAGKLTARERIDLLLDPGSFTELDMFARHRAHGFGLEDKRPWGDGVVTGYGKIDGRQVFVFSQDFTVFGGSLGEVFAEKIVKVMDLAMKMRRARHRHQRLGRRPHPGGRREPGRLRRHLLPQRRAPAASSPRSRSIIGPCAGGAVYSPAITDFIFMVRETSHMFITGPDVIKTVTGEDVTHEELGGAETPRHPLAASPTSWPTTRSDCLEQVRELLSFLPQNNLDDRRPIVADRRSADRAEARAGHDHPRRAEQALRHAPTSSSWSSTTATSSRCTPLYAQNIVVRLRRAWTATRWASSATSPGRWPARSTSTPRSRPRASCASATPSTSRWSRSWTCPASCPAPPRSTAASSGTAPSCSTPTARRPCRSSPSSRARPTAAPTS